jgi:hypothetical protein
MLDSTLEDSPTVFGRSNPNGVNPVGVLSLPLWHFGPSFMVNRQGGNSIFVPQLAPNMTAVMLGAS